jgi:hypothetical protein
LARRRCALGKHLLREKSPRGTVSSSNQPSSWARSSTSRRTCDCLQGRRVARGRLFAVGNQSASSPMCAEAKERAVTRRQEVAKGDSKPKRDALNCAPSETSRAVALSVVYQARAYSHLSTSCVRCTRFFVRAPLCKEIEPLPTSRVPSRSLFPFAPRLLDALPFRLQKNPQQNALSGSSVSGL